MPSTSRNLVRKADLVLAFQSINQELRAWLGEWMTRDNAAGRDKTRLEVLDSLFDESLTSIETGIGDLDCLQPIEIFYESARDYEQSIVWLVRLWEYLQLKFDQRLTKDDSAKALLAADKVLWSC
jgi:hypothetical protein